MAKITNVVGHAVSIGEFTTWLLSSNRTWSFQKWGSKGHAPKIKYIRPIIDTRTMLVFNVEIKDKIYGIRDEGCRGKKLTEYLDEVFK